MGDCLTASRQPRETPGMSRARIQPIKRGPAGDETCRKSAFPECCVGASRSRLADGSWLTRVRTGILPLGLGLCLGGAGQADDVGRDWGVERRGYADPETGIEVVELTQRSHVADNLYFHFSNFTADNRYLILVSNRTGSWQLYRVEVETGRIVQLTDDAAFSARTACLDHTEARRLYGFRGREVVALDLVDFTARKIGEVPPPDLGGFQQPSLSGDGEWLAMTRQRDEANWEIGLMRVTTGEYRTVITQGFRVGHVQHSPVDALIFYVWETGGYAPQRSWMVQADGTGNRPMYYRTDPKTWFTEAKEWVTHEAWVPGQGKMTMINDKVGLMMVNSAGQSEMIGRGNFWHGAASPDGALVVLDDMGGRLWLMKVADGSTLLLAAGLRDAVRTVHPHPSFDRRGHYVQFHSGRTHETVAVIDLRQRRVSEWLDR